MRFAVRRRDGAVQPGESGRGDLCAAGAGSEHVHEDIALRGAVDFCKRAPNRDPQPADAGAVRQPSRDMLLVPARRLERAPRGGGDRGRERVVARRLPRAERASALGPGRAPSVPRPESGVQTSRHGEPRVFHGERAPGVGLPEPRVARPVRRVRAPAPRGLGVGVERGADRALPCRSILGDTGMKLRPAPRLFPRRPVVVARVYMNEAALCNSKKNHGTLVVRELF